MKKLGLFIIIGLFFAGMNACEKVSKTNGDKKDSTANKNGENGEDGKASGPLTTVQWEDMSHDFGKINDQDSVSFSYKFKNTGSNPLMIENVKPSCGCTAPVYSKEPVAPGGEGFVTLSFSPHGKTDKQTKTATVKMNTEPAFHSLQFSAEISKK